MTDRTLESSARIVARGIPFGTLPRVHDFQTASGTLYCKGRDGWAYQFPEGRRVYLSPETRVWPA